MSDLGRRMVSMFEDDLPASVESGVDATASDAPSAWGEVGQDALVGAVSGDSAGVDPAGVDPVGVDPASVDPASVDPVAIERLAREVLALPVWLGGGPLEGLSSPEVLEFLAACDVLEARAAAAKRAAAATLEERLGTRVHGQRPKVAVSSLAVDEIALRLGISHQRAGTLVGEGDLLNGPLIEVGEALAAGTIDAAKAGSFARVLCNHTAEIGFAVVEAVLPLAPTQVHDSLNRTLNAELIRVDPNAAALRYERAMTLRRLEPVRLQADGMASLRLVGPVFDLATIYTYADATARATKATGDQRTMDQLRADAVLTAITHPDPPDPPDQPGHDNGPDISGPGGSGPGSGGGPSSGPGSGGASGDGPGGGSRSADLLLVGGSKAAGPAPSLRVPAVATWAPLPEAVVEGFSFEELGAYEQARAQVRAADCSVLAQVRALVRQARAHQPRRRRRATTRGQLHATDPKREPDQDEQLTPRPPLVRACGPASRLTLVLARAHLQPPDKAPPCPADLVRDELYGEHLEQSTPSSTNARFTPAVLGRDVPHLLGFGPLTPALARTLVADPPGHLTVTYHDDLEADHARWLSAEPEPHHDPSAALTRHIQTYYPTCIAPACSVRATSTDTDHTIEYPLGPTHVGNLRPLCRRHHNLKTHHGHRLIETIDDDGNTSALTWVTPLGTRRATQHHAERIAHQDD